MEKRKYSIVIPVYQVVKYVERMLNAVVAQTYSNWELILVDDGSDDGSGAICERYAAADKRIQVFHIPNQGPSNARNYGMDRALGDYILFLDSDDVADNNLLESIEVSLAAHPAEIVVYGAVEEYKNSSEEIIYKKEIFCGEKELKHPREIYKEVIRLEQKTLLGYPWNKAYKLDYLRRYHIRFENITMIEDILFNIEVFRNATAVNTLSSIPYHYAIRHKNSLTAKYLEDYFSLHEQRIKELLKLYGDWNYQTPAVMKILANIYCRYFFSALQRNCDARSGMNGKQKRAWIRNIYQTEVYEQLCPYLAPDNKVLKVLAWFLRHKSVVGCWIIGGMIYIIRTKFTGIFDRIKQNR